MFAPRPPVAEGATTADVVPGRYATRVANIRNGTGSPDRLNGSSFLRPDNGLPGTVFDDGAADLLEGNDDQDWFFSGALDELEDRDPLEELDLF